MRCMNAIPRAKIRCNIKFDDDEDDDDDDDDGEQGRSGCDYVVALETDNTLEILSSEDGQLINVIRYCPQLLFIAQLFLVIITFSYPSPPPPALSPRSSPPNSAANNSTSPSPAHPPPNQPLYPPHLLPPPSSTRAARSVAGRLQEPSGRRSRPWTAAQGGRILSQKSSRELRRGWQKRRRRGVIRTLWCLAHRGCILLGHARQGVQWSCSMRIM